jgi:hypothetical protein
VSIDDHISEDRFGLFAALLIHHIGGGDDGFLDLSGFPLLVLRVYKKSKVVLEKRFSGDRNKFLTIIMTRVFLAKLEEDAEMLAIEQWLDVELREAGFHPREFN